jgi:hypothetical protein
VRIFRLFAVYVLKLLGSRYQVSVSNQQFDN